MFTIYDKNMNKLDLPKGVTPLDIFISSIRKRQTTSFIEGSSGHISIADEYDNREIQITLRLEASDTQDYRLLRDEIYSFFLSQESFYVSETFQPGKRYNVRVIESFIPERLNRRVSSVEIPLEQVRLPFAESIGTTGDITGYNLKYSDELWSYGMGLSYDEESHRYIHASREFSIYNAGNVAVHPFEQDLKIKVGPIYNSDNFLEIKNKTTGETLRFNEGMSGKEILIDGPNITVNGLQALRKTNRKFISLAPGWNDFEIKGTSSSRIEFDFRFYYK